MTPQRVARLSFNTQREPRFPLKPAYDVRRESTLVQEPGTGRDILVWGGEPPLFDCPKDTPLVETKAPQGDSGARGITDELAPPPVGAEFSPEILA